MMPPVGDNDYADSFPHNCFYTGTSANGVAVGEALPGREYNQHLLLLTIISRLFQVFNALEP
jgi:hypothetical protein